MSEDEELDQPEPDLGEDLEEDTADVLDDDLDDLLDDDLDDATDDVPVVEVLDIVVADVADEPASDIVTEDDEEALDLDEELHPDDVETPLDALLLERTASTSIDEEEDDLEEEDDVDGDERTDGSTRILPRRPGEFVCSSCFLVLPRHQLADEKRKLCRDCA
jgi:hypothetical protein